MSPRSLLWGGVGGLGFAAGLFLQNAVLLVGAPLPSADLAAIEAYYTENAGRVTLATAWVAVNVPFLLLFVAALTGAAQRTEAGGRWARVASPATAMTAALFGVATAMQALLVARMPRLAQDPAVLALAWDIHSAAFGVVGFALGVLVAALGLCAHEAGLAPRWLVGVALASGALLLAGGASASAIVAGGDALWITMSGFLLWVVFLVVMSVRMLAASRTATGAEGPRAVEA